DYCRSRYPKPSRHIHGYAPTPPRQPAIAHPALSCAGFLSRTSLPRNPLVAAGRNHQHAIASRLRENQRALHLLSPQRRSLTAMWLLVCPKELAQSLADALPRRFRAIEPRKGEPPARHLTARRA